MDASAFAGQVRSYKTSGNYGQSYGSYTSRGGSLVDAFSDAELQDLAQQAYAKKPLPKVNTTAWVPGLSTDNAKVFVKPGSKQAVVAFAGTRPWRPKDLWTDAQLAAGRLQYTNRFKQDKQLLERVRAELPGYNITTTGHSLGGSIAERLADDRSRGVAFNPGRSIARPEARATSKVLGRLTKDNESRYNTSAYVNRNDFVSFGRYLDRDSKRTVYYSRYKPYRPFKNHNATYYRYTAAVSLWPLRACRYIVLIASRQNKRKKV